MTRFRTFVCNAAFMTASALAMRGVGVLFNLYLTAKLGAAGLGLYSLVSSVYGFAVTVAVSGVHLAVTRVTAERTEKALSERALSERALADGTGVSASGEVLRAGIRYALVCGGSACILLLLFSAPIGTYWLHDARTVPSLRILALSLPFLSLSTVLGGYFMGTRRGALGSAVGICGQLAKIGASVFLLRVLYAKGLTYACAALAFGGVLSEILTFFLSSAFALPALRKTSELKKSVPDSPVGGALLRIAVPIALTTYVRSGLLTVEHLLIPIGLQKYGSAAEEALASYGTLHGMAMPILLFPMAFLASVSGLLVPELAAFRSAGNQRAVSRTARRVFRVTAVFAVFCAGVMRCFSGELGTVLYKSAEAGRFLRLLSPLVIIMYLDTITDALLKGLDKQVASMWINILDAGFSALLVWLLLPRYGIMGYVFILYASELLNFGLSAACLLSVPGLFPKGALRAALIRELLLPLLSVIGGTGCTGLFFSVTGIRFRFGAVDLTVHILVSLIFYGTFLLLTGSIRREEAEAFFLRLRPEKRTKRHCGTFSQGVSLR